MAEPPSGHRFFSLPDDAERRRRAASVPDPSLGGRPRVNAFGDAPGPRDWTPTVDPLAPGRPGIARPSGRDGGRSATSWLATVVTVLVAGVVFGLLVAGRHRPPTVADPPTVRRPAAPGTTAPGSHAPVAAAPPSESVVTSPNPPVPTAAVHMVALDSDVTTLTGRLVPVYDPSGPRGDCLGVDTGHGVVVVAPVRNYTSTLWFYASGAVIPDRSGIVRGSDGSAGPLVARVDHTVTLHAWPGEVLHDTDPHCGAPRVFWFDNVG